MLPRENGYMAEYRIALPLLPAALARCEPHSYALPSGGTGGSPSLLPEIGYRTMAKVQLDNIRKVYDNGQVAVHGASFEVADGELMVLVGPSGCGKSTLLRMIAGLEEISGGELRIGERVVNDVAPKDRDIAMVFQSYALYPHMTVAENLAFGLKLRGESKEVIASRVAAAAETLGLTPMLDKLPRAMSGGQRQRVALGRALVREPAVFLLDEPLSNLDAKLRHSVRTEIAQLHRKLGTTMIYVTHDQVEAMTLGQRIVVLKDGRIQQIDTPMALYDRPANLFVAGFLGSPAMNVLQGQLVEEGGLQLHLAGGARVPLHGAHVVPQWLGRQIAVGVRPEHLQPSEDGQGGFEATIEVIEPVGNEIFVNLSYAGQPLVMRVAPRALPGLGERLRVAVRGDALHFFDAESGERLESRESGFGNRESQSR
jgi:multiple sugar transport system ATP-binding protein